MAVSNTNRLHLFGTECEYRMARRPWWLKIIYELISFAFAALVTVMAFAVVLETSGVVPIAATVIFGMFAVLMIFGVQVDYLRVGDFVEIGMSHPEDSRETVEIGVERPREREEQRSGGDE